MRAEISECKQFRYFLESDALAETGLTYGFFGVNPSRADGERHDSTTRKWDGFVIRWGGRRWLAGNPFAFRSHDVKQVAVARDPVGPLNYWYLQHIMEEADVLVPCWGSRNKLPRTLHSHLDKLLVMLRASNKPIMTFGLTNSGDPAHPLMLGYSTPLIDLRRAA